MRPERSPPASRSAAAGASRCAWATTSRCKLDADIVVTLDADGQHLPEEIPILVEPIIEDRADHVNGSRMLGDYEGGHSVRSTWACTSSPVS